MATLELLYCELNNKHNSLENCDGDYIFKNLGKMNDDKIYIPSGDSYPSTEEELTLMDGIFPLTNNTDLKKTYTFKSKRTGKEYKFKKIASNISCHKEKENKFGKCLLHVLLQKTTQTTEGGAYYSKKKNRKKKNRKKRTKRSKRSKRTKRSKRSSRKL